jgi:AraC-like DNA-binding protein
VIVTSNAASRAALNGVPGGEGCPGCARCANPPPGGPPAEVFPGVLLADAFAGSEGFGIGGEVLAVRCCFGGWCECGGAYVGPGDTAVSALNTRSRPPEGCRGAALLLEVPRGCDAIRLAAAALGDLPADAMALHRRVAEGGPILLRGDGRIQQIFMDMLASPGPGYRRLKALELFALLGAPPEGHPFACPSTCRCQTETARRVHEFMTADLSQRMSLAEASRRLLLPMTAMKACFKRVYGLPVDTYMRRLRMDEAARLLRHTRLSVAEISERVGYASPARFTACFHREMRLTPTACRNLTDQNG